MDPKSEHAQEPELPDDAASKIETPPHLEESAPVPTAQSGRLAGWRFYWVIIGIYTGLFLATIEVSIVSTALVAITDDLKDFAQASWIIASYLVTYTGFLVIWAQFSDVLGRKPSILTAVVIFIIASAGCSASQTVPQLTVLRAFQGIGGAGMYNMTMMILSEATEPSKFPVYVSLVAVVTAIAFTLGPLVGGVLTSFATWRWIFWINLPVGVIALAIDLIAIPNHFPYHALSAEQRPSRRSIERLDWIGAACFLGVSICLVSALQEVNVNFGWGSSVVIALLVVSGLSLVALTFWERFVTLRKTIVVPVLSWRFATRRSLGLFMASFLVGAVFTCATIQIPQRFQTIHGYNAFQAGLRLLAFIVLVPVGAIFGSVIAEKTKLRPAFALIIGSLLQLAGAIGFATLSYSTKVQSSQYGFQVILGLGSGISNAVATNAVPQIVAERKDIPASLGANTQFRYLGGAIGFGISTVVFNSKFRSVLSSILSREQLDLILQSTENIATLTATEKGQVLHAFATSFTLQWKVILAFISAQVPASLMML